MRCPTVSETLASLLALLPRGRAWQSNDGGPEPYRDAPFDPLSFDPLAFDTDSRQGSILYRFWEAVAHVVNFANERLCALALEMFCATQSETRDLWMAEYGLPDACDPFPDLCTKVAAQGGTRCEYFADVAARVGWSITCIEEMFRCSQALAGKARASRARAGGAVRPSCRLIIVVDVAGSPAFVGKLTRTPLAGRLRAGQRLSCGPSLVPLHCLLERMVPAHMEIDYRVI